MNKKFSYNWTYRNFEKHWQNFGGYTKLGWWLKGRNIKQAFVILRKVGFPKTAKILDFGCGSGHTLTEFRRRGFKNSVGIDNSQTSIRICQRRGFRLNKDIFLIDGVKHSFNHEFDLVFAEGLLEHFSDFTPVVRGMTKASKKYIFLIQGDTLSPVGRVLKLANRIVKRNPEEIDYREEDYIKAFAQYGFDLRIFERSPIGEMLFLLFATSRKPRAKSRG